MLISCIIITQNASVSVVSVPVSSAVGSSYAGVVGGQGPAEKRSPLISEEWVVVRREL